MKTFRSRAFSTAARRLLSATSTSSYVNDLVQRTLAQHGLAPKQDGTAPAGVPRIGLPKTGASSRKPANVTSRAPTNVTKGASFTEDRFACAAGTRRFLTYVPATEVAGLQGLIVMLHGCTQTPEDFAAGTRMNELAEKHRLVIVYPHQSRGENAQTCWNWFRRADQRRGRGEPAILSGLAENVAARHGIRSGNVFVAGLSAGGAMAAILGETYPDVFAAIGVHSGLPVGAAKDVPSAFAAMSGNPMMRTDTHQSAPTRTIVLHGTADSTVHPANGQEIVRQLLDVGPLQTLQTEDCGRAVGRGYRRNVTTDESGVALVEHWEIDGLGHAWSGGSPGGSYTDAEGPDASAEIVRFFLQ
jgi:poly(hydroxyalkanoate) depolymerase family esterase